MSNACARDSCSSRNFVLSFFCFPAFFTLTFGISMEYLVLCLSSFIRCLLYTFSVHLPSSLFTFIPLSFHLLLVILSPPSLSLSPFPSPFFFRLLAGFLLSTDRYAGSRERESRGDCETEKGRKEEKNDDAKDAKQAVE